MIKKYNTFIKYILVAIISFGIDIAFFNLFNWVFANQIILSTILARVISSSINYLLNKDKVFQSKEKSTSTITKYFTLVVVQMLISAFVVDKLYDLFKNINPTFIKVPVEFTLFICNYLIQKIFIFKKKGAVPDER